MDEKYCPDCRTCLPTSEFTRNRRSKDGLAFYCGPCARARHTASRRRRHGPPKNRGSDRPAEVPEGSKWCPECDTIKPVGEFARNRSQPNGLGTYCKPCHNRIGRRNRDLHGGARNYHLRRRYGITAEHADAIFHEQAGLCAICREAPAAHIDHDHTTGRVRGLLCFNCNGALGQFRDRSDLMIRAVLYLRRDDPAVFQELPAGQPALYVGPTDTGRPADEPSNIDAVARERTLPG